MGNVNEKLMMNVCIPQKIVFDFIAYMNNPDIFVGIEEVYYVQEQRSCNGDSS